MRYFPSYRFLLPLLVLITSACVKVTYVNRPPEGTEDTDGISLSLSITSGGVAPTRMTTAITQDGAGFRGIEQVYVVPFQTDNAIAVKPGDSRLGSQNVYLQNPAIAQTGLVANNHSHLYENAEVPLKTNRVLAYGKAFDAGEVSTQEGKHKNGVLIPSGLDNPSEPGDISFCLERILQPADSVAIEQTADELIDALNGIVEVLQASGDADILAFLDVFAAENEISACSYQTLYRFEQNIMGALSQYNGTNPNAINIIMERVADFQTARNAAGAGFPANYGVPEGAVGMWWNGHRFVKLMNQVNISLVPVSHYAYPPSLWYCANSAIRTSSDPGVHAQYVPQNATWDLILNHYNQGAVVTSSTCSVAIVDQMQYGDALVEFRFLAPEGNAAAAGGCPLTGIIIGDQKDVDYSFAPKASSADRFVYDNNISGVTMGGTTQFVQVLVLPTADNQVVHFALEFRNNTSSAFQCQQGTVQPGCKFYLAGELNPADGTVPSGQNIAGVFNTDHKTTVYVKVHDLANAYNTVPDLRDPQLEIGVTAEMDWIQVEPGGIKLPY